MGWRYFMRPTGNPEILEQRRKKAIKLLREGFQPVEVSQQIGVDRRSVRRWKAAYLAQGRLGIKARPNEGRPPKLDDKDKKKLEQELLEGASSAGFPTDLWTCPRVVQLIKFHFGISYHVDHIGRLLHSMGWSPQKPERRAMERDEKRILTWRRSTWPRIKKKPRF
jgi:transposase